ncbi:MAG TPA: class I SAM-dependent methyltransferase [Candidatus Acidoferrales bacterium]|nr:class I SAM-dependent methyltransferase [Candidatus Acidoferrales bacterium]
MSQDLQTIYLQRFAGAEKSRDLVWQVLTRNFFQRWVNPQDVVLDVGAGFCEFINNIQARQKLALDLNPATVQKANSTVTVISQDVTKLWPIVSESVDVVFSSNFFEHLSSKDAFQHCLTEIHRVLQPNGRLVVMGPNIRFCYRVYWDFFDHLLPLSDRSVVEGLEITGFKPELVVPRFLPYTMKGKPSPHPLLVRLYLALPIFWPLLGKQFLILARKAKCPTT